MIYFKVKKEKIMNFIIGDSIMELTQLENSMEISNLYVPPSDRKKGVAHKLFKHVTEYADDNDITLTCQVFPYSEMNYRAVIKLCEKYGFVLFGDKLSLEQPFQEMIRERRQVMREYTTKVTMEITVVANCSPKQVIDTIEHALNFPTIGHYSVKKVESNYAANRPPLNELWETIYE